MDAMEWLKSMAGLIALFIETAAVLVVALGAAQAIYGLIRIFAKRISRGRKQVWQKFAAWLILGLEFMLAADILRTAISPNWNQIGQLAAIALIRTFLNYFLEKDLERSAQSAYY